MKKMKKITRLICIMLALLLFWALVSCAKEAADNKTGEDKSENGDENSADAGENSPDSDKKADKWAQEPINLPDEDFGGREFNVITVQTTDERRMYDRFAPEEQNAEPIIDALYKRRLAIEERYNVAVNEIQVASPWDTARKSILAGDLLYDLIVAPISNMKDLASQSLLSDIYTTPYISADLDKPWWDQRLKRDLSINGKLYFQAGNIVLRDKLRVSCLYFNKDMFKELDVEYPYQYVYAGTWTIDKLMEISKGVNADLDGNGIMDQYDRWGFMSQYEFALHLFEGSGEKMIGLDSNGVPEITINTPRALDVIQKALAVCIEPEAMFHADGIKGASDVWATASEYFQEDRFMIRASVFEAVPRDLRAMPADFGVLPTPKYNEQQENYYTYVEGSGLVIGIPTNADLEYSGLITEALAYESGSTLMPAFYDLCLTSKVLRDDESEGMLDIMFDNRVYDIGYIYQIGGVNSLFSSLVQSKSADFVSAYEKKAGSIEKALEKFIDTYDKN
ncbi:MAG: extracellular solute-binding protein [Oscillospiraceae bacterium]|nr:extracellular solute-binding protein [Oscillospiraceae bacterium]